MSDMNEPSLLDYLKEKISLKRFLGKEMSPKAREQQPAIEQVTDVPMAQRPAIWSIPWRSILAVILALVAQRNLEPATRNVQVAVILYIAAAIFLVYSLTRREWQISSLPMQMDSTEAMSIKKLPSILLFPILIFSFFAFSGNRFSFLNIVLWVILIITALAALRSRRTSKEPMDFLRKARQFFSLPQFSISFKWWDILLLVVFLVTGYFRLAQLDSIPNEMISDHAEKLLDVYDVLNGQYSIFFPRNTGREAFQFYLTALVSKVFGTGVSFLSLKLGTALMGLVTLIYVYRIGKELGNRWVGLLAVLLMGIAYWPNVIARIGLRFALAPLFVAPLLFYLFRGLRKMDRNDFILAGVTLGIGLHGYSTFRITPFLVAAAVLLFILHVKKPSQRSTALWGFLLIGLFALILFLPLARYWSENPAMFGLRALSRLGSSERALPGPVLQIFFSNFWKASIMPFWENGNVWAHSVPYRPALDVVSAAFYLLGVVAILYRYIRERTWQDLVLLVSIPILLMPSILSLAFPEENPALNRTGGAAVPVFIVTAIAFEGFITTLWSKTRRVIGRVAVVTAGLALILVSCLQNYDLVFKQYAGSYAASSWNTSQIGKVVSDFIKTNNNPDAVWVVGIPHWVDTRLVGINSGYPAKDYAIWPEQFDLTKEVQGPKLFIVRADDQQDLDTLKSMYPNGVTNLYPNTYEGRAFYSFMIP